MMMMTMMIMMMMLTQSQIFTQNNQQLFVNIQKYDETHNKWTKRSYLADFMILENPQTVVISWLFFTFGHLIASTVEWKPNMAKERGRVIPSGQWSQVVRLGGR